MKKQRRGIPLDSLPEHTRRMVERQIAAEDSKGQPAAQEPRTGGLTPAGGIDSPPAKKRGKKRREMNGTEREFFAYLRREYPNAPVEYEPLMIRWGEGAGMLAYTPDFVVRLTHPADPGCRYPFQRSIYYEVKGAHAWKQDIVRFKAARAAHPHIEFQLWEKDSDGRWHNTI